MSINPLPLSNAELQEQAQALFAEEAHHEVSDKYFFIPTIDVIEEIKAHNWYPVSVSQANVREDKEGYQTHLVKFQHFSDLLMPNDNAVQLLLFNSHDRSKSMSISAGIYRYCCANGLVIADSVFEEYKIRHIGDKENDVAQAITNITSIKSTLMTKIKTLESICLSDEEKESFALSAIPLRFEPHLEVDPNNLLIPHREEDAGNDIYTTLNVIQENLIRGGNISGVNTKTNRRFTSKDISSIAKDTAINKGLWNIAERILAIKEPTLALAA